MQNAQILGPKYYVFILILTTFRLVIFWQECYNKGSEGVLTPGQSFYDGWNDNVFDDAFEFFGAHPVKKDGKEKTVFRVWAPSAAAVSVIGDFNGWQNNACLMKWCGRGIWEATVDGFYEYDAYKFAITTKWGEVLHKADPFAFHTETPPKTASKLYRIEGYEWQDSDWLTKRKATSHYSQPINIYEVHLGSWQRFSNGQTLDYITAAHRLGNYAKEMGYTHVELLPITEHPFDGSWGYQVTGYFAPTSRFGSPKDFMCFVDILHQNGIGVILDWVPAHFPKDAFGLFRFDGTPLYEYSDPRKGEHRQWGTAVFDYGKNEILSFLISSARFWLEKYHLDGLRVDAVASMLYLDYGRQGNDWCPNIYGGHENLEAVEFLKRLSHHLFGFDESILLIAEESTAWPGVTRPTYFDGLGFNFKWNMGWMNDMLSYMSLDPLWRKYHQRYITFSFFYAFSENYILPLSHDEVVHGKGSMIAKMPGDYHQKFMGLRAFYAYMIAHPGKKLLFMGQEFGQFDEWKYNDSLQWNLLEFDSHRSLQGFVKALNSFYLNSPPLWEKDISYEGFCWICGEDTEQSIVAFRRKGVSEELIVICNFVPVGRRNYRLGLPFEGEYSLVFSSDDKSFGGSDGALKKVISEKIPFHGLEYSAEFEIPPLSVVFYKLNTGIGGSLFADK